MSNYFDRLLLYILQVAIDSSAPHASDLLSSLEAAVSSLDLDGSLLLLTHGVDAILGLDLTDLGLYRHRRVLHLCTTQFSLDSYKCKPTTSIALTFTLVAYCHKLEVVVYVRVNL